MYQFYIVKALQLDPDSDTTKGFYQWSSMSFFEIYMAGWDDRWAQRTIQLAYWMIDVHKTLKRRRNTGYAYEGLISAWQLARESNDSAALLKIGQVIALGLPKLTSWQVGGPNPNAFLRDNPTDDPKAIGGIMNSCDEPTLRVDVVQHQMHAVILAQRYFLEWFETEGATLLAARSTQPRSSAVKPLSILFVGDTSFGENYQADLEKHGKPNILKSKGYDYCFAKVSALLQQPDLVIANLETPLTDLSASPLAGKKQYIHWSDRAIAPMKLKQHRIGVVSLANNHTLDYGFEGLQHSLEALAKNGIIWFGAGADEKAAARPLQFDFNRNGQPLRLIITAGFEHREREDTEYQWYATWNRGGVNVWTPETASQQIQTIRLENPDAFIVAYPHWGKNYDWRTKQQTKLAHALVDAGANLVIGHGAHLMQEIEHYKNCWIVYSLGNFVFNSPGRYRKLNVEPFSFASRLEFDHRHGRPSLTLRLYPIMSDNLATQYQPYLVKEKDLKAVQSLLVKHSPQPKLLREAMTTEVDDIGACLVLGDPTQINHTALGFQS
jgi:hypothetical protein